ncbi:hypothetical protein STENM223S_06035 [Streptomyces tendae]
MTQQGGHGGHAAGPIVADVLRVGRLTRTAGRGWPVALWAPSIEHHRGHEGGEATEERDTVGSRRAAAGRRRTKPAVIGSVAAVLVAGAGFGAYAMYRGDAGGEDTARTKSAAGAEKVKSGPLTAAEVTSTAQRFLTAWQKGASPAPPPRPTTPVAAKALLTSYVKDARVRNLALTPGARRSLGHVLRERAR